MLAFRETGAACRRYGGALSVFSHRSKQSPSGSASRWPVAWSAVNTGLYAPQYAPGSMTWKRRPINGATAAASSAASLAVLEVFIEVSLCWLRLTYTDPSPSCRAASRR